MTHRLFTAALICAMTAAAPSLAADFTMKIASPAPLNDKDALSAWFTAFEAGVETRSEGRIDVQLFPGGQLGPIPATVEGVAMGTIEVTVPIIGFLSSLDPRFQVLDAPGLFDDEHHAMATLSDPSVRAMLSGFGARSHVEPLVVLTSGQSVVVSDAPIAGAADLAGVKLRTGGATPLLNEPMAAIGASPVAMSLGEALPGIQTGTIDAANINMPVAIGFKFADVAPNASYLPGSFTIVSAVVSKDFLGLIGPDLEAIVREEAERAKEAYAQKLDSGAAFFEGLWTQHGGQLTVFTEAERASYLAVMNQTVQEIIATDDQLQSDYGVLKTAADAARR